MGGGWYSYLIGSQSSRGSECLDLPSAYLQTLNGADLMQLPLLEQINLGMFTDDLLDEHALVACEYLPVLKRFTYGFYSGESQRWISPRASSIFLCLQAAFASHVIAPFHVQQWASVIDRTSVLSNLAVTTVVTRGSSLSGSSRN